MKRRSGRQRPRLSVRRSSRPRRRPRLRSSRWSRPTSTTRTAPPRESAGAAPVYIGQPGYGTHLDRDRDGVGCEG
ncbi:excalibur calcium-binding domain-containing protein [Ornithinimicrobium sp. LYQ103]|uniref:excalibur calcium-binding domain-containing protein n=1 Tax=Ornithinimicrobium sp. LYQ103 TaxID=3378796 RepID=UPI0038535274